MFLLFLTIASLSNFSAFAGKITQRNVSTVLSAGKNGPEAVLELDRIYNPEGRQYAMSFEYSKTSLVKNKKLDCNNVGITILKVYYNNSGKRDSTWLLVSLDDNNLCPKKTISRDSIFIAGDIKTLNGNSVDAQAILYKFDLSQKVEKINTLEGKFVFDSLGQEFYGLEIKNTDRDFLSGVSTADIVKIQRHILDIERFNSPYQYLSADVNGDKRITSADIQLIRDMILGRISSWPNLIYPYIYIPEGYKFVNNTVPWNSMPEKKQNIALNTSQVKNYVAIKYGDVNGSTMGNLWENQLQGRSSNSEDAYLEEEMIRNDILIAEMEAKSKKENFIFEILLPTSSLQGWKK